MIFFLKIRENFRLQNRYPALMFHMFSSGQKSGNQLLRGKYRCHSAKNAQNSVTESGWRVSAADQLIRFESKGRKSRKPTADSHLNKRDKPRAHCVLRRERRNKTDQKRSDYINEKSFNGESIFRLHRDQSDQISPHCTAGAACSD
jgi:hypothetical protein